MFVQKKMLNSFEMQEIDKFMKTANTNLSHRGMEMKKDAVKQYKLSSRL